MIQTFLFSTYHIDLKWYGSALGSWVRDAIHTRVGY